MCIVIIIRPVPFESLNKHSTQPHDDIKTTSLTYLWEETYFEVDLIQWRCLNAEFIRQVILDRKLVA